MTLPPALLIRIVNVMARTRGWRHIQTWPSTASAKVLRPEGGGRDGGERSGAYDLGSHEDRLATVPIEPYTGRKPEQNSRPEPHRAEHAHLRRVGVQRHGGRDRQRQQGELVAEHRYALADP